MEIEKKTGISYRTVKNWIEGKCLIRIDSAQWLIQILDELDRVEVYEKEVYFHIRTPG